VGSFSQSLQKQGIQVSDTQCLNKWKSLKREYKKTVDYNSQTGNDRKTCPFMEDFDDLFGHKSGTKPSFLMSSMSMNIKSAEEGASKEPSRDEDSDSDNESSSTTTRSEQSSPTPGCSKEVEKPPKMKKRKTRQDANYEFLQKYTEKQEEFQKERLEILKQQHQERMSLMEKMIDCLKQKPN
jgi:hypothetical protein